MQWHAQERTEERLKRVEQQFARWRRARSGYGRIPHELWEAAAEAAAVHGVQETAERLQLEAGKLKQWMRDLGKQEPVQKSPQFVELMPLAADAPPECTLEMEDASGRKLRICLKGDATAQALQLGQMLWRSQA